MNPLVLYRDGKRIATLTPGGRAGERFLLGRAPDCDVVVADARFGLAPRQLAFVPVGSLWWAEELTGEPGALTVGGAPAVKAPLVGRVALTLRGFACEAECESEGARGSRRELAREWLYERARQRLSQELGGAEAVADAELERKVVGFLDETLRAAPPQLAGLSAEALAELRAETVEDMLRLGPLEPLIADDSVTEIMVIDHRHVFVERKGKITLTERAFRDPGHLIRVIERIVTPVGRRIDESSPLVDARLADGSRVNAVIPPITPDGACLTIRKFGKALFTLGKLVAYGSMTPEMAAFIDAAVALRKNIVVSGGTGSGKTSLLNAISLCIGADERIVTIEDSLELRLQQRHVVRMEARPANAEGKGEVSIRALVKNALRMRPDRIVVGECRGGEALDMLQAMNTGHDGSLTTVHANTPADTVARLETLCLMAGMDLPLTAIRAQIVSAVDLIVQTARLSDGSRKVTAIAEVVGLDERGLPLLRDLFAFRQSGVEPGTRKVLGAHKTLAAPRWVGDFALRGIPFDEHVFDGVRDD